MRTTQAENYVPNLGPLFSPAQDLRSLSSSTRFGKLQLHMPVALLLATSNVVGLLVHAPSLSRDAGHAVRRSTQLQMGVVRKNGF